MLEHVWIEETCSLLIGPRELIDRSTDLATAELYFVWGLLMDPAFIKKLTGHLIPFAPAVLRGYRRETFLKDGRRGFNLVQDPHGIVMGVVLVGLTEEEIACLDRFEEVPHVMVKEKVQVQIGDLLRDASIYMKA